MVASADASESDKPSSDEHPQARTVLDENDIARALTRITHEILERNRGSADVLLLGIPTRGVHLARRVARRMGEVEGREIMRRRPRRHDVPRRPAAQAGPRPRAHRHP